MACINLLFTIWQKINPTTISLKSMCHFTPTLFFYRWLHILLSLSLRSRQLVNSARGKEEDIGHQLPRTKRAAEKEITVHQLRRAKRDAIKKSFAYQSPRAKREAKNNILATNCLYPSERLRRRYLFNIFVHQMRPNAIRRLYWPPTDSSQARGLEEDIYPPIAWS